MSFDPKNIRRPKVRSALGERTTERVGRLSGWRVYRHENAHGSGRDRVSLYAPRNPLGAAELLWLAPEDADDLVDVLMAAGATYDEADEGER